MIALNTIKWQQWTNSSKTTLDGHHIVVADDTINTQSYVSRRLMGSDMNCGKMKWWTQNAGYLVKGIFYDFMTLTQGEQFEYEMGMMPNDTNYRWTPYTVGEKFPPTATICGFHSNGQAQYIARMEHTAGDYHLGFLDMSKGFANYNKQQVLYNKTTFALLTIDV